MIRHNCISTEAAYNKYDDAGACCISSSQMHQTCYCLGAVTAWTSCKALCDQDLNCKGYSNDQKANHCNIATTSDCSAMNCAGPYSTGFVGELSNTCTAYDDQKDGCFIKLRNNE